jgi:thioredoxin 1
MVAAILLLWGLFRFESAIRQGVKTTMNKFGKIAIVLALVVVVGIVLAVKSNNGNKDQAQAALSTGAFSQEGSTQSATSLPRLVDLGSVTCIPCKMMAPVLDALREEYAGSLQVDFIDVNKNHQAAQDFGIRVIPTQVFLDASGKELWRHEGFFSKDDIMAKWKELGITLQPAAPGGAK